jgi:hypothetical protein
LTEVEIPHWQNMIESQWAGNRKAFCQSTAITVLWTFCKQRWGLQSADKKSDAMILISGQVLAKAAWHRRVLTCPDILVKSIGPTFYQNCWWMSFQLLECHWIILNVSLSLPFFAPQLDRHSLWHTKNNSADPSVSKQCPHCFAPAVGSVAEAGPAELSGSYGCPFCETHDSCLGKVPFSSIFSIFSAIFNLQVEEKLHVQAEGLRTRTGSSEVCILVEHLNKWEEH